MGLPCDSKDLGVAKIAHSTTLARPVLPEGSSGMALINFLRVQNPNPAETSQFCSARQRHCQDLGEFGFAARRLRPSVAQLGHWPDAAVDHDHADIDLWPAAPSKQTLQSYDSQLARPLRYIIARAI